MISIVGLGPAGLDQIPAANVEVLEAASRVIVRTLAHPAATELAARREIETCDDIYAGAEDFEQAYRAIAERVLAAGEVVYAVPGHPSVGERTVELIRAELPDVRVLPAPSFLDALFAHMGIDPLAGGLHVLDARSLRSPLLFTAPVVVGQLDTPLIAAEVKALLLEVLPAHHPVAVARDLGGPDAAVRWVDLSELDRQTVGPRTSLYFDPGLVGWPGLLATSSRLRRDCPWDAKQTHHSLVRHLIEEAYEVVEAVGALSPEAPAGEPDVPAYLELEDELGDLLLQVVFHATLASEAGVFDIDSVAERHRQKLVRRHPHVFGVDGGAPIEVDGASEVSANWERIKQEEKQRESLMDDVPAAMPALARAAKLQRRAASVGFDWTDVSDVLDKVREEVGELAAEVAGPESNASRITHELGDVLFSLVNLGRHLHLDPEMALRQSIDRFSHRFRTMEAEGPLQGLSLEELDTRWERAKAVPTAESGAGE